MANDQLKDLHLFVMQSCLPIGMGIYKNAKAGGFKKVVDILSSKDPISGLQIDGETDAKNVRDKIDQLIPGLGNPVVSVDVTVEENYSDYEIDDRESLVFTLKRIDRRLTKLSQFIDNDLTQIDD